MRAQVQLISIVGALLIAACSTNNKFLDLSYPPVSDVKYDLLESAVLENDFLQITTVILTVQDNRENTGRIGNIRTQYVYTDNNVEVWVYDAITHELATLGYEISDVDVNESSDISSKLIVELQELDFDIFGATTARVTLRATFQPEEGEPVIVESPAELTSGLILFDRDDSILENLARTLQMSIRYILRECGFRTSASLR